MEPIHYKLLHQKERWKITPCLGLLTHQQMDKEKLEHVSTDPTNYR
jgi:hypothetical protein